CYTVRGVLRHDGSRAAWPAGRAATTGKERAMQYRFGAYCFEPARYDLRHAGQPVALRPQACELLAYLLQHRDRVVPKEELLAQVWPGQYVGDGVLHACVLAVRTALHDTGRTPSLLHTVRGRGYRFVAPVEPCDL